MRGYYSDFTARAVFQGNMGVIHTPRPMLTGTFEGSSDDAVLKDIKVVMQGRARKIRAALKRE